MAEEEKHCIRCNGNHALIECSWVKAVEFYETGDIKRVEFLTPADAGGDNHQQETEPPRDYERLGPKG